MWDDTPVKLGKLTTARVMMLATCSSTLLEYLQSQGIRSTLQKEELKSSHCKKLYNILLKRHQLLKAVIEYKA